MICAVGCLSAGFCFVDGVGPRSMETCPKDCTDNGCEGEDYNYYDCTCSDGYCKDYVANSLGQSVGSVLIIFGFLNLIFFAMAIRKGNCVSDKIEKWLKDEELATALVV